MIGQKQMSAAERKEMEEVAISASQNRIQQFARDFSATVERAVMSHEQR
jgi:hypothetical protein